MNMNMAVQAEQTAAAHGQSDNFEQRQGSGSQVTRKTRHMPMHAHARRGPSRADDSSVLEIYRRETSFIDDTEPNKQNKEEEDDRGCSHRFESSKVRFLICILKSSQGLRWEQRKRSICK